MYLKKGPQSFQLLSLFWALFAGPKLCQKNIKLWQIVKNILLFLILSRIFYLKEQFNKSNVQAGTTELEKNRSKYLFKKRQKGLFYAYKFK